MVLRPHEFLMFSKCIFMHLPNESSGFLGGVGIVGQQLFSLPPANPAAFHRLLACWSAHKQAIQLAGLPAFFVGNQSALYA